MRSLKTLHKRVAAIVLLVLLAGIGHASITKVQQDNANGTPMDIDHKQPKTNYQKPEQLLTQDWRITLLPTGYTPIEFSDDGKFVLLIQSKERAVGSGEFDTVYYRWSEGFLEMLGTYPSVVFWGTNVTLKSSMNSLGTTVLQKEIAQSPTACTRYLAKWETDESSFQMAYKAIISVVGSTDGDGNPTIAWYGNIRLLAIDAKERIWFVRESPSEDGTLSLRLLEKSGREVVVKNPVDIGGHGIGWVGALISKNGYCLLFDHPDANGEPILYFSDGISLTNMSSILPLPVWPYISENGCLMQQITGVFLRFANGRTETINGIAGSVSWIDKQDRLRGYIYTAGGNLHGAWVPRVNTDGSVTPGVYDFVSEQPLAVPDGWTTDHKVIPDTISTQLGFMTNSSTGVTTPFVAVSRLLPEIAVDADRDGTIKLASEDDTDTTSADKPFRLWINDDDDSGGSTADGLDTVVNGANDLKDFFPVYLDIKQLLNALPPSGNVKYILKQEESALNFVYTNLTRATAFSCKDGTLVTGCGPTFTQAAAFATTQQITATGVDLFAGAPGLLDVIQNQNGGVILVEGRVASNKPLVLSIEKDGTVLAEVKLELAVSTRSVKLWETANKANQIFNPTQKDDPWGGDGYGGSGPVQNGAPRNMLFLVPDPQDNKYKATLELEEPPAAGTQWIAAAYVGETKVANSDKVISAEGKCDLAFEHLGTSNDIENFTIRIGLDANNSGTLDPGEIIKLDVKGFGEPTVRGSNGTKYAAAKQKIDDIVSGDWNAPNWATNMVLPHAKRFLQLFRDGNFSDPTFPADKKPTGSNSSVTFDAFNGYFAEWLTHNSGAPFNDAGVATITEYTWDQFTSAADLIATSPQIGGTLRTFYDNSVMPIATSYFANLPVGSPPAYFPSSTGFYDIPHTHESPVWVPATTETFDTILPNLVDDVNGTIGRGRLLNHKVRYRVEKQLVPHYDSGGGPPMMVEELVVTRVVSQGTVIDLYDFNHMTGGAGQDAAVLQIGHGKGSYVGDRNRGKIYRNSIEFVKTYTTLP